MALGSSAITAGQLAEACMAIPAFVPVMLAPGYLTAWFADFHRFRQRSLAGRILWSIPLSLAISTIASVLIARFFSLTAAAALFAALTVLWIAVLLREGLQLRRAGLRWNTGWNPHGGQVALLAAVWIVLVLFSLVDLVSHGRLFFSAILVDLGARVNWTESILRTGVPPMNPLYFFQHPAGLRQYYFWYVLCATVARLSRLPVRAVFVGSCVWGGFSLAALIGLYLREFLHAGERLRQQFLTALLLLAVTGLDLIGVFWQQVHLHRASSMDIEWWSQNQISSWMDSLLWVPHHVSSMVCCFFAFLLVWMAGRERRRDRFLRILFVAACMASAFGLSIYVAFGFFLLMLAWGAWQLLARSFRPVAILAISGAGALLLLSPYFWDLMHTPSYLQGGSVLAFTVREMIPPDDLLRMAAFRHMAAHHPVAARWLANLILLAPGYVLELGFYLIVLLVMVTDAWRGRVQLTSAQRTLVFLCLAALPMLTFLRSAVLNSNDFGWRAALLLQFPLLLLGAQLLDRWKAGTPSAPGDTRPPGAPGWLRRVAALTIILGLAGTAAQIMLLRFGVPMLEQNLASKGDPIPQRITHTAFISIQGYKQLDPLIPRDAIVQFNPDIPNDLLSAVDQVDVDHQVAIAGDEGGCGSELGGDPRGCPMMAAALDGLYRGADAGVARSVCRELGIHYLVARVYDPAWKDRSSWIWTLPPVVAQQQFRALDCQ